MSDGIDGVRLGGGGAGGGSGSQFVISFTILNDGVDIPAGVFAIGKSWPVDYTINSVRVISLDGVQGNISLKVLKATLGTFPVTGDSIVDVSPVVLNNDVYVEQDTTGWTTDQVLATEWIGLEALPDPVIHNCQIEFICTVN